ncbi:RloB domain-containing protein [Candidatus Chloroploca sp. M-50]|uniref:RloB domain-containing protein n=2 Tax=Candidatus Chloroploca mongolica TaxID=2528176 RepID=A0ABS4DAI3_9CHLR|nr:RloB domain-containing protein [Candidatus Chloroploca mongolica]
MSRQKRNNRARNDASFGRRNATRIPRPVLLIVCEGAVTEDYYFNAWRKSARLATVTIEVYGGAGQPDTVVGKAKRWRDERKTAYDHAVRRGEAADPPFEQTWCVFDREGQYEAMSFRGAVQLAEREQIKLAISNPCFEYWYLLHFQDTGMPFHHGQEVKQALRRYIHDYQEASDCFKQLEPLTLAAIERARQRYERHPEREWDNFPNPSTTVYELVAIFYLRLES